MIVTTIIIIITIIIYITTTGGSVPKEYIPGVQKGIESVLGAGVVAGFPVLGIKATLVDGSHHDITVVNIIFNIITYYFYHHLHCLLSSSSQQPPFCTIHK